MSSKKSKLDLLVRVRYQNPIPPPAFPPLLVDLPTELSRLARPDFIGQYAASVPLPMMIDGEIGMPLDLNAWDGIWSGEAGEALNPRDFVPESSMHPDDLLLLDPPSSTNQLAAASSNGTLGVGPTSQMVTAGSLKQNYHKPEVSWLRTTTYATKDTTGGTIKRGAGAGGSALGRSSSSTSMVKDEIEVDASMQAQVQAIERTFWHHDQYSFQPERGDEKEEDALARIKHPRKRDVHAVEAYDILPDDEMWGHNLVRVDYPERPAGKSGGRTSDFQLAANIFCPIGEKRVAELFLPSEDQREALETVRANLLPADRHGQGDAEAEGGETEFPTARFDFIREYDLVNQVEAPSELVIAFCDGSKPKKADAVDEDEEDDIFDDDEEKEEEAGRPRGVYYSQMQHRIAVRKRRVLKDSAAERQRDGDGDDVAIDAYEIAYEPVGDELAARIAQQANKVRDPEWVEAVLRGARQMGEAEVDGEAAGAEEGGDLRRI